MLTNIYVTGGNPKKVSERELVDFANFCLTTMIPKCKRLINIEICYSSEDLEKDTIAECTPEGEKDSKGRAYEFIIQIRPGYCRRRTLSSLAHELVHVKQYVTGEMRDSPKGFKYTVWNGKQYDDTKTHYYDHPWEIDAYGREEGLVRRYLRSIDGKQ
jgi:hypothetical protein